MIFIGYLLIGVGAFLMYAAIRGLSVTCLLSNGFGGNQNCSMQ